MLRFRRRVETHRPVEEVYDYLADFETTNEWDPRASATRRLEGDGGVDTRYGTEVAFWRRTVPMTYTVTCLDRPHRIGWVGLTRLVRHEDTIDVVPGLEGTAVIDYTASFDFRRVPWLVEPLLRRSLLRLCDEAATGLTTTLAPRHRAQA